VFLIVQGGIEADAPPTGVQSLRAKHGRHRLDPVVRQSGGLVGLRQLLFASALAPSGANPVLGLTTHRRMALSCINLSDPPQH